jgi:hypothetical protein
MDEGLICLLALPFVGLIMFLLVIVLVTLKMMGD